MPRQAVLQLRSMRSYSAYGLGIRSELELPELEGRNAGGDVLIKFGHLGADLPKPASPVWSTWTTGDGVYLYWDHVGLFRVRDGREIVIDPSPGWEEARLRLFLLGAAMGVLLHQRGLLVLHASAVAANGGALLFLGAKGLGKSTTAAALLDRGYSFLADDVVALDVGESGSPRALPAFPQIKLWPDAVACLGASPDDLPRLSSLHDKRGLAVTTGFSQEPVPLAAIYVLSGGQKMGTEALRRTDGMIEIVRNLYVARFGKEPLRLGQTLTFRQAAQVAQRVPVHLLKRPSPLGAVDCIAELLDERLVREAGPYRDSSPSIEAPVPRTPLPSWAR